MVKQYPRSDCSTPKFRFSPCTELRPPSSTCSLEALGISNETIAGSDASDGLAGSALKSVFTLMFCVEIAYIASLYGKTSASSVSSADGAIERLAAPRTAFSSYRLPPLIESPSTSKKVVKSCSNGAICSCVPAWTKMKSNSAPRMVVGVPSTQLAVTGSSSAPE